MLKIQFLTKSINVEMPDIYDKPLWTTIGILAFLILESHFLMIENHFLLISINFLTLDIRFNIRNWFSNITKQLVFSSNRKIISKIQKINFERLDNKFHF